MKKILLAIALPFIGCCLSAQPVTITLQPDAASGIDAIVESHTPTTNYGTALEFASWTWTFNSVVGSSKSLIKFDLSSIPVGATITSANLSLYYSYNTGSSGQTVGNDDCYLQEVTSSWNESTVNWNNQPPATTTNQVYLPASTSTNQSYPNIDVTAMTQDAVNSPSTYYGWELSLLTMQTYRSMKFGSSDNPDSTIRPKLVITYTDSQNPPDSCITLKPGPVAGLDAIVESHTPTTNYGTALEFASWTWTFNSVVGSSKSLIKFDLSSIPAGSMINSADLSFFYSYNTGSAGQTVGNDDCYLQEVTSPWTESTVNWNNQPTATTTNQVYLPASTTSNQSYPNIDVTAMTQDAVNSPSTYYGWELSLLTMQTYRSMKFASSDNPDSTIWPELTICYTAPSGIHEVKDVKWSVFPNPASTFIAIHTNDPGFSFKEIQLFDMQGRLVLTRSVNPGEKDVDLPVSDFANGIYFVQCVTGTEVLTKRVAIVH